MRWIDGLLIQLRMVFRRGRENQRLNAELQFHLDQQIAENIASGMAPKDARHAALRAFGNPIVLREQARESWKWNLVEQLIRDTRYGMRTLSRTPGFSLIVVLVMGLGIGATVAMFTVVHSVLMKPLPFKDQGRLVRIYEADSHDPTHNHVAISGLDFFDWQHQDHSFEQMAIAWNLNSYNLSGTAGQLPEHVMALTASWNMFRLLGVRPALGRFFNADDDRPDANATVVLSWGLWKRRFGGDRNVLGQTIRLDAKPYTVIGVLPPQADFPDSTMQLWTPLFHETPPTYLQARGAHNFQVIARLKRGVTVAQAQAEMRAIQAGIHKRFPSNNFVDDATHVIPLLESRVGNIQSALLMLLAATGCLLLIGCLNTANLLVARSAARRREVAIRTALGGSRWRLIRAQLVESTLLCIAGGTLGLMLAWLAIQWLFSAHLNIPRAEAIHLDGTAVLAGIGLMVFCGLFAGLIPVLALKEKQILGPLQDSTRAQNRGHASAALRRMLLSLELTLTVILLVGAGLLLTSYQHLREVNLGCRSHNVLTVGITLPDATYKTPIERNNFYDGLLQRVRDLPGVRATALTDALPGDGDPADHGFYIPENPPLPQGQSLDANVANVDPGFFQAMQIPLIKGRFFQPNERLQQSQFAIVNQSFVRKFFPNTNPIGKHINDGNFVAPHNFEIVGVVGDVRGTVAGGMEPTMYFPLYRGEGNGASLVVVTEPNPLNLALPIQKSIADMDPNLAVSDILTMDQVVGKSTMYAGLEATLLIAFAVGSLLLAAVGLFGVLSYLVAQRRGEIGIRLALGAQREQVLWLVLLDGLRPALAGLALGLGASAATGRLLQSMLYGTAPLDLAVFASVAMLLLAVAGVACLLPAWRAAQLDPMQALRTE